MLWNELASDFFMASFETLYMVFAATLIAFLFGLPLGTLLFVKSELKPHPKVYNVISSIVNVTRSIPFIILLVAMIPFTRFLIGTSIGTTAAIVPLTLGAIPFVARLVESAFQRLPHGLIEVGFSMGATSFQMIRHILLPEALPAMIEALTLTAITLVGYSAMAGTVGGGGLGDLAIRYGYQRFDTRVMLVTILILIVFVQAIQGIGNKLARRLSH